MARQITVELVGDTRDFERAVQRAGGEIVDLEKDLKSADAAAGRFESAVTGVTGKMEGASGRFRDTADLAGGLGNVLGIEVLGQVEMYATGIADMADGMSGLLGPALAKSQVLFKSLNMTMLSNPIFLVIAALAALTIGFVIAYKKSETFRQIVHKVFDTTKRGAIAFKDAIVDAVVSAAKTIAKIADIITTPYQIAFQAIKAMWNATLGGFGVSIPGFSIPFGPSFGGLGFTIPHMAKGGIVNGPTLALIGEAGPEAVVPLSGPNSRGFGGTTVNVIIATGASDLDDLIRKRVRVIAGGNVQKAFGSA